MRTEQFFIFIVFAVNHVANNHGRHHGVGHSPFIEAGNDINVFACFGVITDKGKAVIGYAIVSRPLMRNLALRKQFLAVSSSLWNLSLALILPVRWLSPSDYQILAVIPEGQAVGKLALIRGLDIGFDIVYGYGVGLGFVHSQKNTIPSMFIMGEIGGDDDFVGLDLGFIRIQEYSA